METTFLAFGPDLLDASRDGPVITPNERLTLEISRFHSTGAPTTRPLHGIYSWHGWLRSLYEHAARRQSLPRLLPSSGLMLLIQKIAPECSPGQWRLIEDAWTTCHDWALQPDQATRAQSRYADWHQMIHKRLQQMNAITAAQLEDAVLRVVSPVGQKVGKAVDKVTLVGFDQLTSAQQSLLDGWRRQGLKIRTLDLPDRSPDRAMRVTFGLEVEEIRAAAWWARRIIEREPSAHIGVLVPGLESRRDAVARQFGAILDPERGALSPCFDVSGGTALDRTPLWLAAEPVLRSLFSEVSTLALVRALRSPLFDLQIAPTLRLLPEFVSLAELARHCGHATLQRMVDRQASLGAPASLAAQVLCFEAVLDLAGWQHAGIGTVSFQIQQASARCMRTFAAEAAWQAHRCSAADALDRLREHLQATLHAASHPSAPIRVMGYLETPGLSFSHLWITGAAETTLPAPAQANPLLSRTALRAAGMRRVDAASELEFARMLTGLWRRQSRHLVVSHASRETGETVPVSPLLADLPAIELTREGTQDGAREGLPDPVAEAQLVGPDAPPLGLPHPWLLNLADAALPWRDSEVSVRPRGLLRGGTALLQDQAQCAFLAFAIHRLQLRQADMPHPLLDALERGDVLHRVLERLMRSFPDQQALAGVTDAHLGQLVETVLEDIERALPDVFIDAEVRRLRVMLRTWIDLELQRPPFSVIEVESSQSLDLDGWRLQLKLDRVDKVGNALLVIDYKSGNATSTKELLKSGARAAPQLPAYALARDDISAVAYANFKDTPKLDCPINRELVTAPPVNPPAKPPALPDWETHRQRWRKELIELMQEHTRGPVVAAPTDPGRCKRCHVRPLCRHDPRGDGEEDWGEST